MFGVVCCRASKASSTPLRGINRPTQRRRKGREALKYLGESAEKSILKPVSHKSSTRLQPACLTSSNVFRFAARTTFIRRIAFRYGGRCGNDFVMRVRQRSLRASFQK